MRKSALIKLQLINFCYKRSQIVKLVANIKLLWQGKLFRRRRGTRHSSKSSGISYKSFKVGEQTYEYKGAKDIFVTLNVKHLAFLCPVDIDY